MKSELIVALDVSTASDAVAAVKRLSAPVRFYKIGLELFCSEGPSVIEAVAGCGKDVFLDLKLHDIPRTVERAVLAASRRGVRMLTVHASGGKAMLKAAADAARSSGGNPPAIIAVTALTSLDVSDLHDLGVDRPMEDHVKALAELAVASGVDGLVCSPREVSALRAMLGPKPLLVVPGIRPAGDAVGDQKRVATPAFAVKSGASHLVVGRPILEAADPVAAAQAVLEEMKNA